LTIVKVPTNTELRSLPFARESGYSSYRSIMDGAGRVENLSAFGDVQSDKRVFDVSINFSHGYFDDELNINLIAGGTFTNNNSLVIADVALAGDVVEVKTLDVIEYQAGAEAQAVFNARFTNYQGDAIVQQFVGCSDMVDGYFIGAQNGLLTIGFIDNTTITEIDQNSFNLDKIDGSGVSGFNIDITKLNSFRIQYGYMGSMPTIFEVFGGSKLGWIPIYVFDQTNTNDFPQIKNPMLPLLIYSTVISGTPNIQISVGVSAVCGGTIGAKREIKDLSKFATVNEDRITGGDPEKPIIGIRVMGTFRGATNVIPISVLSLAVLSRGNQEAYFEMWGNAVIPDGIWNPIDSNNSVVEVALNEFNFSGGRFIGALLLTNRGNEHREFEYGAAMLRPNENLIIIARSDAGSDVGASLRWGEVR